MIFRIENFFAVAGQYFFLRKSFSKNFAPKNYRAKNVMHFFGGKIFALVNG
jgi:hypothetical protein